MKYFEDYFGYIDERHIVYFPVLFLIEKCEVSQDLSADDSLHQQSFSTNFYNFLNVYKFFDRVYKV